MATTKRRTRTPNGHSENTLYTVTTQTEDSPSQYSSVIFSPISQSVDISYLKQSLSLAAIFALTIYARTYVTIMTRNIYPVFYSVMFGQIPDCGLGPFSAEWKEAVASFICPSLNIYVNGREAVGNFAYNYGPIIAVTGLVIATHTLPIVKAIVSTSIKKTFGFFRDVSIALDDLNHNLDSEADEVSNTISPNSLSPKLT